MKLKNLKKNSGGFTLLEVIASLALFSIIILLVSDVYLVSQRAYNKNAAIAELTQNARVSLDRISRELRQSADIITSLPPTDTDPGNPPSGQIFFRDGHDVTQITYLRYYLDGSNLMREHKAFYFDGDQSLYVAYGSLDQGGGSPREIVLENRVVGEYFSRLEFWGANGLTNISLGLTKNQNNFSVKTSVFSRNR